MKLVLIACVLFGCTRGEEEFRKEREAGEKANAMAAANREKLEAPFRAFEAKYKAAAPALLEEFARAAPASPGIEKAKGRKIAPFLRSKIIPSGEERKPSRALWCQDHCNEAPWIAQDPTTAGIVVVADIKYELLGQYVDTNTKEKRGDAYDVVYTVSAALMPEKIIVATWVRHGEILAGYAQYDSEMPIAPAEFAADIAALTEGTAPAPKGAMGKPYTRY